MGEKSEAEKGREGKESKANVLVSTLPVGTSQKASVLNGKPKRVLCFSFPALSGDLQSALCQRESKSGNTTSLK